MFEINTTELLMVNVNVIRFIMGSCLVFFALIGKPTRLDREANNATFVYLTGLLLIGMSIS